MNSKQHLQTPQNNIAATHILILMNTQLPSEVVWLDNGVNNIVVSSHV